MLVEGGNWKVSYAKSKHHQKDEEEDMICVNLRVEELFFTDPGLYWKFPFDELDFKWRFEISHFEDKDPVTKKTRDTYRFDYYRTLTNEIMWKPGVDFLPEFDMDFERTRVTTLVEKKPYEPKSAPSEFESPEDKPKPKK